MKSSNYVHFDNLHYYNILIIKFIKHTKIYLKNYNTFNNKIYQTLN